MKPFEIVEAELRDIHLPSLPDVVGPGGFTFLPLAFLLVAVLVLAVLALYRQRRWRHQAQAALAATLAAEPLAARWQGLLTLRARVARHTPLPEPPDCAYWPPVRVGEAEVAALTEHLRQGITR